MAEVEVFKIDIQPVVSELAKLGSELEKARAKYQETKNSQTEYSEDAIRAKAEVNVLSKEFNALTNVLTNQQKGLGELKKATEANIDITKIQNNTIETNRKLYNALYNQQLRNPSEVVAKQVKALSDTLKEQESALGNNKRKVGDYAGGFKDAIKELQLFGVSTGDIAKGLDAAKSSFSAAGGGVKGFSAALATTGLPLVIMAVQGLINVFEQFKPVADAVENATTALAAGFKALVSGGSISDAVSQSLELLETLRNLEDTQAAFNLQSEKNRNEIDKLIISSKDRSKTENERIALLEKAEKLEKENFNKATDRVDKLLLQEEKSLMQTLGLTADELKALATIDDAKNKSFIKAQAKAQASTSFDEEALKKYQATLQERAKLDGESAKFLEKSINSKNSILEKEESDKEKRDAKAAAAKEKRDAAEAARLEKLRQEQEKYNNNLKTLSDAFLLDERQRLEKGFEDKKATITGVGEQEIQLRKAIEDQKKLALDKFDQDAEKKRQENQKRIESEIISGRAKEFNAQIEANKRSLDLELQQVDLSVGTEREKLAKKRELNLNSLEDQLELTEKYFQSIAGVDNKLTDEQVKNIQKLKNEISLFRKQDTNIKISDKLGINDEERKKTVETLNAVKEVTSSISNVINAGFEIRRGEIEATKNAEIDAVNQSALSEEEKAKKITAINKKAAMEQYEIQKKQFEINKATQIIQAIISTAAGIIAQYQAGPAGIALAVAAAITGAAQIAVIAAQKPPPPPKFKDGVIGLDGAGSTTSDSIDAKLSRGESVMTARATERFAPILAQMEMAVGNRPNFQLGSKRFATGFIPTTDGGYAARDAANDFQIQQATEKAMRSAVMSMPKPVLEYSEFTNFTNSVSNSVSISEL